MNLFFRLALICLCMLFAPRAQSGLLEFFIQSEVQAIAAQLFKQFGEPGLYITSLSLSQLGVVSITPVFGEPFQWYDPLGD